MQDLQIYNIIAPSNYIPLYLDRKIKELHVHVTCENRGNGRDKDLRNKWFRNC